VVAAVAVVSDAVTRRTLGARQLAETSGHSSRGVRQFDNYLSLTMGAYVAFRS
jgi:hypothetical protein